jgi:hypothetical protein
MASKRHAAADSPTEGAAKAEYVQLSSEVCGQKSAAI